MLLKMDIRAGAGAEVGMGRQREDMRRGVAGLHMGAGISLSASVPAPDGC